MSNPSNVSGVEAFKRNTEAMFSVLSIIDPALRSWHQNGCVVTLAGQHMITYSGVLVLDDSAITAEWVAELGAMFSRDAVPLAFEFCTPTETPSCAGFLESLGYQRTICDLVMSLDGAITPSTPSGNVIFNPKVSVSAESSDQSMQAYWQIMVEGFGMPTNAARGAFETMLRMTESRQLLARLDGDPVGSGMLLCCGGASVIYNVATLPTARRQGVGTAMMVALHEMALKSGYSGTVLAVQSNEALQLYTKLGYKIDGYRSIYSVE